MLVDDLGDNFTVALWEPKIPQNVGNIGRLVAAANCCLHLVGALGFIINDRHLKRAALDYWPYVNYKHFPEANQYLTKIRQHKVSLYSTKATKSVFEHQFTPGEVLVFGAEDKGLPADVMAEYQQKTFCIPMYNDKIRSLNLSNSVAIVLYQALKQIKNK